MKKTSLALWIVGGCAAFVFFVLCLLALILYPWRANDSYEVGFSYSDQIAVIDIEGLIFDAKRVIDNFKLYRNNSNVKAIVLRINSPGGGVAASQEIYEEVKRLRKEKNKKVVASMSTVAASGGYYIACAADKIIANAGSITGSIGVIAEWINYEELLKWAKLREIVFKSGEFKDSGSPTRPLTNAEKVYFQSLINGMHQQFVQAVCEGRQMETERVKSLADGRVFTGEEAKKNGLIDEIGTLQDAINVAAKLAKISGEPKVVTPRKHKLTIWDFLNRDPSDLLRINPDQSNSHIRFAYLWR